MCNSENREKGVNFQRIELLMKSLENAKMRQGCLELGRHNVHPKPDFLRHSGGFRRCIFVYNSCMKGPICGKQHEIGLFIRLLRTREIWIEFELAS